VGRPGGFGLVFILAFLLRCLAFGDRCTWIHVDELMKVYASEGLVNDWLADWVVVDRRLNHRIGPLRLLVFLWKRFRDWPHVHSDLPIWPDHRVPQLRKDDSAVRTHQVVVAFLYVRADHIDVQEALLDQALHSLPCLTDVPCEGEFSSYGVLELDWRHVCVSSNNRIDLGGAE
jgi:hypothetical protein